MLASSINVSAHPHLCDVCMEHAESCSPLAQHSCIEQHSSSSDVNQYARNFDCNLCMHVCHDPVVTKCGHLFCWPCLYYQISLHSGSKECPVCKADVQDKIVPLYGCGKVGYSTDSLAGKFRGMHIPCRPSATRWIAPIASSRRREPNRVIHSNEMHTHHSTHSGFCASILRFVMATLPPQNGGLLYRYAHRAVSLVMRRRRFNNEKEFACRWAFICVALVASAMLLAC